MLACLRHPWVLGTLGELQGLLEVWLVQQVRLALLELLVLQAWVLALLVWQVLQAWLALASSLLQLA